MISHVLTVAKEHCYIYRLPRAASRQLHKPATGVTPQLSAAFECLSYQLSDDLPVVHMDCPSAVCPVSSLLPAVGNIIGVSRLIMRREVEGASLLACTWANHVFNN